MMRTRSESSLLLLLMILMTAMAADAAASGEWGNSTSGRVFTLSWTVPAQNQSYYYNDWAQRHRFRVGDTLYFRYSMLDDSLMVVTAQAYNRCDTNRPLLYYTDGNTQFRFNSPGRYFFISGVEANCIRGERLIVAVLHAPGDKGNNNNGNNPAPSQPNDLFPSSASPLPSNPFALVHFLASSTIGCSLFS